VIGDGYLAPERIRDEYAKGDVKIVIFTNQSGIYSTKGYNAKTEAMLKGKLKDIIADVGVPVQVFMAGGDDEYRKPSTKTWDVMVEKYNCGVKPALDKCIFVGDAAGRLKTKKHSKDFSCSDRKFGYNIGYFYDKNFEFKTPEEYFDNIQPEPFDWCELDKSNIKFDETIDFKPYTGKRNNQQYTLYDTNGITLEGKDSIENKKTNIIKEIKERIKKKNPTELIHCIFKILCHRYFQPFLLILKYLLLSNHTNKKNETTKQHSGLLENSVIKIKHDYSSFTS